MTNLIAAQDERLLRDASYFTVHQIPRLPDDTDHREEEEEEEEEAATRRAAIFYKARQPPPPPHTHTHTRS